MTSVDGVHLCCRCLCSVLVQIFLGHVILEDFTRVDSPLSSVSGTFHTRYDAGFERVPFLKQFVDALRIGALEVRQALQVSRLPA